MTSSVTATELSRRVRGGIGESPTRPDGLGKVRGEFAFSSDLSAEEMLWGATLRSPHARARIRKLDVSRARTMPGVAAVLTADDVPGSLFYGLEVADQPVLASRSIQYWGEPIAIVAATTPEIARLAVAAIEVEYDPLDPVVDPEAAERAGDVYRRIRIRRGDQTLRGEVVVEGYYEIGMQDQAPLGTESGLAVPDVNGGVDLYAPSQWIHKDHEQIAAALGLDPEQVRVHPAGVGGAFGGREDLTLQIHLCMLALRTGDPVRMIYDREESFAAHVHRHPARMWYRHEANRDGELVRVEAKLLLDGGAYVSASPAVTSNAAYFAVGPYRCSSVSVDGVTVKTNNPACGAMRGFGAVQACFGHESQMDRLAAALGIDPVVFRLKNALAEGDPFPTSGQVVEGPMPVEKVLRTLVAMPLPAPADEQDPRELPGGTGLTTPASSVVRGVGYAIGVKNLAFSEGKDDPAEARVLLTAEGAEVHTAAAELGQGVISVAQQVARTTLGMERVDVVLVDTSRIGSAGRSSASRQTQMTGGAVHQAAKEVRAKALSLAGGDELTDEGVLREGRLVRSLAELCADGPIEAQVTFRHPPTEPADAEGQGRIHAGFAVAAHRAVVDVDPELGLVRVARVDTVQDAGKVIHPGSALGQVIGGILQGVGLAVMEELLVQNGRVLNPGFTDYLIPTFADAPEVEAILLEEGDPWGPFGAKGIAESPTVSSTAAVIAAIRDATGVEGHRAPIRPEDIVSC